MSLFSRFFRKAPPAAAPETSVAATPQPPPPAVPDRSLALAEEEVLNAAVAGRDAEAIGKLVIGGSSTKVRQMAAHAIEDPAQLRQLIKSVRGGNDKSVYKILTSKRDALLAQERKAAQLHAEIDAASMAIERHSQRTYDALFTPTLEQMEIRWRAVSTEAAPELVQRVQQAIDRAREVIASHLREIAAVASRELAAANAAAEAQRIRDLETKAAAAVAAERAALAESEQRALAEQREAQALAFRQIGGLIRKALSALREGSTGRAAGLRRAIEEKLPTAPALPSYLTSQLQDLDARLADLKDWKSFSVVPKRMELIEEMESLIGATLEPVALADRIKTLQEDWKTLSKGAGDNPQVEWQRFHEAAQQAYQPCREYFEA